MSDRALRLAGVAGVVLLLVALIGIGSMVAQLGRLRTSSTAGHRAMAATAEPSGELLTLRTRVGALRGVLDTISGENARLQVVAGISGADTTTLFRRFLGRLPRLLRQGSRGPSVVNLGPIDSQSLRRNAASAVTAADSLLLHASEMAGRYRQVGVPASPR